MNGLAGGEWHGVDGNGTFGKGTDWQVRTGQDREVWGGKAGREGTGKEGYGGVR